MGANEPRFSFVLRPGRLRQPLKFLLYLIYPYSVLIYSMVSRSVNLSIAYEYTKRSPFRLNFHVIVNDQNQIHRPADLASGDTP